MKTKMLLAMSAALATIGAFAANRVVDLGGGKHAAIFDEPGSFRFIVPSTVTNAAILVVGGGGGGGGISGGGGGGGEVIHVTDVALVGNEEISGSIGKGGAGGIGANSGANGETTTCATSLSGLSYSAIGGGGGAGSWSPTAGRPGACGGGAGGNGAAVKSGGSATAQGGHPGGAIDGDQTWKHYGAGGGGWTEDGYSEAEGGNGGAGYTSAISGVSKMYAYGGGGGEAGDGGAGDGYGNGYKKGTPAQPGENGTGGGGGGGQQGAGGAIGGDGGRGTVVIWYAVDLGQLTVDFESSTRLGIRPYEATFSCTAESTDLSGLEFTWDFGDGSAPVTTTDTTITHTYSEIGSFTVSLTGRTNSKTHTKTFSNFVTACNDTIYVDKASANPVWPYATEATAATTLTNALSAVGTVGQTILVAPGIYNDRWVSVTNAVRVVGTGADPSEVVLTNSSASTSWDMANWVLNVANSDALVANITVACGKIWTQTKAPGLASCLTISAGTVSNCVIRGGWIGGMVPGVNSLTSAGVLVNGADSLLTHSIVEECQSEINNTWSKSSHGSGASVMGGGRVENCLFRNINTPHGDIVTVINGEIVNSTIVDCTVNTWVYGDNSTLTGNCYGLCLTNGAVTARNVAIVNVRARDDASENRAIGGTPSKLESSVVNCATDTESPVNATCIAGTRGSFFKDGAYAPNASSLLRDAGVEIPRFADGVDLAGNPRVHGREIDIGCYECQTAPGLTIFVR